MRAHVLLLVLAASLAVVHSHSIGAVSEKDSVPQASTHQFFPDWVPFKNKHGEELGEFIQLKKVKPKKRLAPPVNFILRAVAEPEGDDYYDKGQGESDNEDDFEKKEWSDLNRGVQPADQAVKVAPLNHTDISDIDGVVGIITSDPSGPVLDALRVQEAAPAAAAAPSVAPDAALVETPQVIADVVETAAEEPNAEASKQEVAKKEEEEEDYDETPAEKKKPQLSEEERRQNEAKKAKILDSVDELKERHAEEQKLISERIKEEEMFQEERERDGVRPQDQDDKYGGKRSSKKVSSEYEEYDEDSSSGEDKYEVKPQRTGTAGPVRRTTQRKGDDKHSPPGKQSVFKNPRLYVSYDDDSDETSTTDPASTSTLAHIPSSKFSSKYRDTTLATDSDVGDRISLLPDDTGALGEPTLFFPKKTKNKRRKNKSSTPPATTDAADSTVAETVADKEAGHASAPAPAVTSVPEGAEGAESAPSAAATDATEATDAVPASTDHKEDKQEDYENEKGGGRDYKSEHVEDHGEHGKKAYEGYHEDTKTAKGHSDKERHTGRYDDHGGQEKDHHDEAAHYGAHHHEEHGKKHAKYEESGKHAKGHSTKGSHDIHKKEEYEKNVEFFEEEGDSAEDEKHGGFHDEREHKSGGHFSKGALEASHHHHSKGESGHAAGGGHHHAHKGHAQSGGHDGHDRHGHSKSHKDSHDGGKKWVYHHGHPAKIANLVVIDRRADKYTHGPHYFG